MKKIISFLMCICMILCSVSVTAGGIAVSGADADTALKVLSNLGLWAGVVSDLDSYVTRAEFVGMADHFYGISVEETSAVYFEDVPAQHPFRDAIAAAAKHGLISGNGKIFEPDRIIKTEEALKIMLVAQGFAPYANEKGGYPVGYWACAQETGVINGILLREEITYADVIQLFYQAMESDVLMPVGFGGEIVEYERRGDVLSEYHNIYKITGQVTAVGDAGLYGDSDMKDGYVKIENTIYQTSYTGALTLLGVNVDAYYRQTKNTDAVVVYMMPASNVKILTVDSDNIDSFDDFTLKYFDASDKNRSIVLEGDAALIYNGRAVVDASDFTQKMMVPENGNIILIDNGNGYQVAKITDYETVVVSGVSSNYDRFYDKYTGKAVDLEKSDSYSITDKFGNSVDLQRLSEYDVASVAVSKGANPFVNIVVSADAVEGRITAITSLSPEKEEVQISKEKFVVCDSFLTFLKTQGRNLEIGDTGVFYLDHMGRIAAFEAGAKANAQYAYFIAAKEETFGEGVAKLLDQSGNMRELELASKVKIDEVQMSAKDAVAFLKELTGAQRLMMIEQNEAGALKNIFLPVSEEQTGNLVQTYDYSEGELRYKDVSQCFGGKLNVDSETLVFSVPSVATEINAVDEDYAVSNYQWFANDVNYTVSTFITEKDALVQDIVISYEDAGSGGAVSIRSDARMGIVKKISKVLDDDGSNICKITVLTEGREVNYKVDDEALIADIRAGDGIRIAANTQGYLRIVEKLFDEQTRTVLSGNKVNGFDDINYIFYGKVVRKDGNIIRIEGLNQAGETEQVNVLIRGNLYKIESLRDEIDVVTGAVTDIMDEKALGDEASYVLIQSRYSDTRVVAIYE